MAKNVFKNKQFIAITEKYVKQFIEESPQITRDELKTKLNWNYVPKFSKNNNTKYLRKVFGQLTKDELKNEHREAVKAEQVQRGMQKIYALLDRCECLKEQQPTEETANA